jgi:hypothetical protein
MRCSMTVMQNNSRPTSSWCPTICTTLLLVALISAGIPANGQQQLQR